MQWKTIKFSREEVNFVKRILCILKINSIKLTHIAQIKKKTHNIAEHQRIHRLIAIELIENKLDENKKSIELTHSYRFMYSHLCVENISMCYECITRIFCKRFIAISILIFHWKTLVSLQSLGISFSLWFLQRFYLFSFTSKRLFCSSDDHRCW